MRRAIYWVGLALLTASLLAACQESDGRTEILVFAAASLTNSLGEAVELFEERHDVNALINFAASQALAQQIASGAPAQVFISAGEPPVQFLRERGLVGGEDALLSNRLVVIAKRPLEGDTPSALSSPSVERLALADPAIAPAGAYAREALRSAGLWEALQPSIVTAPDVRSAMAFVEAGNADAGIVYATDAAIARGVETLDIFPRDSYGPVVYPVVTMAGETPAAAAEFVRFLISEDAQRIFRAHGFDAVERAR